MSNKVTLPAFTEDAACSKCGSDDITASWKPDVHRCYRPSPCLDIARWKPECCEFEHIDRTCIRCQFKWVEVPLDVSVERVA